MPHTVFSPSVTSARPSRPAAIVKAVVSAIAAWRTAVRNRREVAMLMEAEDGVLRDLGLTRLDVSAALSEPMWRDPSARLLIWSVERRAAQRAHARSLKERGVSESASIDERERCS